MAMLESAAMLMCASALALGARDPGMTVPVLNMTVTVGGCPIDLCSDTCGTLEPQPDGSFRYAGRYEPEGLPATSWDIRFDPDPFVFGQIVVSNAAAGPADFVVVVSVPVQFREPPSAMDYGGNVIGLLTDGNDDGAWVAAPSDGPLFTALVDGAEAFTLLDAGYEATAPPFGTATVGPAGFGDPIPSTPGPLANSTLAIQLRFVLSPGDTVAINGVFVGDAVPNDEEVQR
ncbi:MAG: hypothetical protein KDA22_06190 [Phycisphaerales bacterium]|nr:hypothetical protein [Phycisphaerales bacterium]